MKNSRFHTIEYLLPALIAGALFVVILALNGLWPFGKATIDYYDMAQWSDLFYYHNYDELRGAKSFIYDWYLNLGREIPGLSEPSLFDLLMYFVPRNMFLEFSSFLMMFKIMAAAFFMGIFVRYINEDMPYVFRFILSAGYGLCGFVMANYTVPQWMDMAALVPLVLMFAQRSLRTGRFTGLAVTIFLITITDYYFSVQMLMFVFLTGGAYCIYLLVTGRKKELTKDLYMRRLVLGILVGLALSSFSWIPDVVFNSGSARFDNGTSGEGILADYLEILKNVTPAYLSRWFSLLGLAFPGAVVVSCCIDRLKKRQWGALIFRLTLIFMVTVQLVLESVHLLLHFGSYVDYPVRNGFMIYCILAGIAAGSYVKTDKDDADENTENRSRIIRAVAGITAAAAAVALFKIWYLHHPGMSDHAVLIVMMSVMSVFALAHLLLIRIRSGRLTGLCPYLWAAEVIIFGIIMIGKPLYDSPYGNDPEQESEYIRISDQLVEKFGDRLAAGNAPMRRIKNPDASLNANYGIVMRRETLAGWSNLANREQIDGSTELGYSSQFTRLLDSGGNIFSDTIIHVTDLVSHEILDEGLYNEVSSADIVIDHMTGEEKKYYLYENRFKMPFAIPVTDIPYSEDNSNTGRINSYSEAMGAESDMASVIETVPETGIKDGHEISRYSISVDGKKALYFKGFCYDNEYYNTKITVNGKTIPVPSIREYDNELFPAHFNNNTVALGSFENESVNVVIDMDISDPEQKYGYEIYEIDLDLLASLCDSEPSGITVSQGRRSLDISLPDLSDGFNGILVPVSYSKGWSATVDGRKVEPVNVNGLFMYVPVDGGSRIHMSYSAPMMMPGIVIACVAAIVMAVIIFCDKRKKPVTLGADRFLAIIYSAAFAAAFAVLYIIPFVFALIRKAGLL